MSIGRYPKNIAKHPKSFKKLQKYQYGLDYLFNKHNEEGYTSNNVINAKKVLEILLMILEIIFHMKNKENQKKTS